MGEMTTAMAFRKELRSEAGGKLRPWIERQVRGERGVRGDRSGRVHSGCSAQNI